MNGLEVIVKQNNKAAAEAVAGTTRKYLVAEYAGLHAIDYSSYDTEEEAKQAIAAIEAKGPGSQGKLFTSK